MMHPARRVTAVLAALSLLTACSIGSESSTPATGSGSSSTSGAQVAEAEPAVATPMLARVLSAPIPVPMTDGKVHLAYELDLTNALGQDLDLRSVTVKAGDRSLLTLSGEDLASRTRILGDAARPTRTFGLLTSGLRKPTCGNPAIGCGSSGDGPCIHSSCGCSGDSGPSS